VHLKNNLSLTDHSGRTYESLFQEMKHDHSMSTVNATCGFVVDNCNEDMRMSGQHGVITDAPTPTNIFHTCGQSRKLFFGWDPWYAVYNSFACHYDVGKIKRMGLRGELETNLHIYHTFH